MCKNKIFLLVILISIQVMFFSCKEKKYAYDNIEIFYRDISNSVRSSTKNNSKVSFKTEIIYIFADGNGWQILDERSKEKINDHPKDVFTYIDAALDLNEKTISTNL